MKSRIEVTRDRNEAVYNSADWTLDDSLRIVLGYAPDWIVPDDWRVLQHFQIVIDGGVDVWTKIFRERGTAMVLAKIERKVLRRARRSWSGQPSIAALYLKP